MPQLQGRIVDPTSLDGVVAEELALEADEYVVDTVLDEHGERSLCRCPPQCGTCRLRCDRNCFEGGRAFCAEVMSKRASHAYSNSFLIELPVAYTGCIASAWLSASSCWDTTGSSGFSII